MLDDKPEISANLTSQEEYHRRLKEFDSSDEENIPPPENSRMLQTSTFIKHINGQMDQDMHIPVDSDSDSDSVNESPKIWKKSPLHLKKTKRRLDRPSSGDGRYPGAGNGSGPHGRSLRSSDSPRTRRSPRRTSAPFSEGKMSSLSAEMRENFQKFDELQRRRQALESTSEESIPNASGKRIKEYKQHPGYSQSSQVTTYEEQDGYSYTKYTRYIDHQSPYRPSERSDQGPEEQKWRASLAEQATGRPNTGGSAIYLTGVPHKTISGHYGDPSQETMLDQLHSQSAPSQHLQPYEGEVFTDNRDRKHGTHRKSSFEHIYDDVDLSLEISRMNQLDFEEKQRKNQQSQHQQKSWEEQIFGDVQKQKFRNTRVEHGLPAGEAVNERASSSKIQSKIDNMRYHEQSSSGMVAQHQPSLHSITPSHVSKSSGLYREFQHTPSPKQDSSASSSGSKSPRSKIDAKSLMEEERRKFEEYKKDYIRQHSSHSEDDELKENKNKEYKDEEKRRDVSRPMIPHDDYEYILRRVYHTRQDAISDAKNTTVGSGNISQPLETHQPDNKGVQYSPGKYPYGHSPSPSQQNTSLSSVNSLWEHHENVNKPNKAMSGSPNQFDIRKEHEIKRHHTDMTYSSPAITTRQPEELDIVQRRRRSRSDSIERLRSGYEGDNQKSAFNEYQPPKQVEPVSQSRHESKVHPRQSPRKSPQEHDSRPTQKVQVHRPTGSPLALRRTFHDDRDEGVSGNRVEVKPPVTHVTTVSKPPQAPKWEPQTDKWEYSQAYQASPEERVAPGGKYPGKSGDHTGDVDQMQFEPHKNRQNDLKETWQSPRRQRHRINHGEELNEPREPRQERSQQWDEAKSHYIELERIRQQKLSRSHDNLFQKVSEGDQQEPPVKKLSKSPRSKDPNAKPIVSSTIHVNLSPTTSPTSQRKLRSALYISRSLEDIPSSSKNYDQLDSHFEKQPSFRGVMRIPSLRKGAFRPVSSDKVPRPLPGESYKHPMATTFERDQMDNVFEKQPSIRGIAQVPGFHRQQLKLLNERSPVKEPVVRNEESSRQYPVKGGSGFHGIYSYPKEETDKVDLKKIKMNLFGKEGDKPDQRGMKKELESVWDRSDRKVSSLTSEVFRASPGSKPITPTNVQPSSQHFDARKDMKLIDFASYRDNLKPRKSFIEDELTDLEKTYESLHLDRDDDYDSRYTKPQDDSNVRRLSITNLRKLESEQKPPRTEPPSMQYAKQWLNNSPSAERQEYRPYAYRGDSFRPVRPEPITSPESLEVAQYTSQDYKQHRSSHNSGPFSSGSRNIDIQPKPPVRSQYPCKVADDMAYRKIYGTPGQKRSTGSGVNSPASYLSRSPATTPTALPEGYSYGHASPRRGTPDTVRDDMAVRSKHYQPSYIASHPVPSVTSPTSTEYLPPRNTPPSRGHMRNKMDKEMDKQYHQDSGPIRSELPMGRSHYQQEKINLRTRSKSLDGTHEGFEKSLGDQVQIPQRRSSLSRDIAKMVHLFSSPTEMSQSAPDLTDQSVFSKHYNDRGELVARDPNYKQGVTIKVKKQQTPRMVKQRSEMRAHPHVSHPNYEGTFEDENESYSSSSGIEVHNSSQSLHSHSSSGHDGLSSRSPIDGAFEGEEVSKRTESMLKDSAQRRLEPQREPSSGYGSPLRYTLSSQPVYPQEAPVALSVENRKVSSQRNVKSRLSDSEHFSQRTSKSASQPNVGSTQMSSKPQPQEVAFRLILDPNQSQPRLQTNLPGIEASSIQHSPLSPQENTASWARLELKPQVKTPPLISKETPIFENAKETKFQIKHKPQFDPTRIGHAAVHSPKHESESQGQKISGRGQVLQNEPRSFSTGQYVDSPDLSSPVSQTKEVILDLKSGEITPPILSSESPYGSRENLAIDRKSIAKFNLGPYQEAAVVLGPGPGMRKPEEFGSFHSVKDAPGKQTTPETKPSAPVSKQTGSTQVTSVQSRTSYLPSNQTSKPLSSQAAPAPVQSQPCFTKKVICEPKGSKEIKKSETSFTGDCGSKFQIRTQDVTESKESKTPTGKSRIETRQQLKAEIKASPNVDPEKLRQLELALHNLQGEILSPPEPGTKRMVVIEKERRSGEDTKVIKQEFVVPRSVMSPCSDIDPLDALVASQPLMSPYASEFEFSDIETPVASASDTDRGSDTEVEDPEQHAVDRISAKFRQHAMSQKGAKKETILSSKSSEEYQRESRRITSETSLGGETVTKQKVEYDEHSTVHEEGDKSASNLERRPSIKELVKSFEGKAPAFMRRSRDMDDVQIPLN
jgi:hypothetical protein